jgi:hypothetical protein
MGLSKFNPTAFLIVALPLAAVIASVGTAVVALSRGDPPLPDQYHWEGDKLDHDFAQSQRAAELRLSATLNVYPDKDGLCHLTLVLDGGHAPPSVNLSLIHVSNPSFDRKIRFVRTAEISTASAGSYSAQCVVLPYASWHIELSDIDRSWSFRSDATNTSRAITLSASSLEVSRWP